ncbi:MAG: M48 family metalloprotease [Gammaproteobacteria bacterium]|nr:M48 family metalloprotease [Gammaproteobacteria bacterium]
MIKLHTLLLSLLCSISPVLNADNLQLPQMGDPVDQTLSPRQEQLLGDAFMSQIRANNALIDDPELNYYLQNLGNRLLSASANENRPFTFFIVKASDINAFAAPGGYIGIHSGLMTETHNEAQLASVLAHEIVHVQQRHIARAQAEAYKSSLTTAAAFLAALVLGSQGKTQESQAVLYGGLAASQQLAINFTRANEHEADRLGIHILVKSGFNPKAMAQFFTILRQKNDLSSDELPEYLRTHPLNNARIAEAKNRAANYSKPQQQTDSLKFQLMRMRLRVKTSEELPTLVATTRQMALSTAPSLNQDVWNYGSAIALAQLDKAEEGLLYLQPLLKKAPENIHYLLASAQLASASKQIKQAEQLFSQLFAFYPNYHPAVIAYAHHLENNDQPKAVVELLRRHLRESYQYTSQAYSMLAQNEKKLGNNVASREALAEYYAYQGELKQAIKQLKWAIKELPKNSPDTLRIKVKIETLETKKAELEQE